MKLYHTETSRKFPESEHISIPGVFGRLPVETRRYEAMYRGPSHWTGLVPLLDEAG